MQHCTSTAASVTKQRQDWLDHLAALRRSPKTISTYGVALKNLGQFFATRAVTRVADVQRRHLEAWRQGLSARGCKPATVDLFVRAARGWFRWLADSGRIFINPAAELETPKFTRTMGRFPSEEEMRRLLESVGGPGPLALRDRALLETAYSSAARRTELAGLDVTSADLVNGVLRIRGKGEQERVVPLTTAAVKTLQRYLAHARPRLTRDREEPAMFVSQRGGRRLSSDAVAGVIKRRAARAGFQLTPHGIRRAVATHLVRRGASAYHVKELLGHKSFRHLASYALLQTSSILNVIRQSRLNR